MTIFEEDIDTIIDDVDNPEGQDVKGVTDGHDNNSGAGDNDRQQSDNP